MSTAFYNEWDSYAADWLRNLCAAGHIAPGTVDQRSIRDVRSVDLAGFERVHFFAGIGGWDLALRLAGWPAGVPVWTGSCPCQPFSAAGKRGGFDDDRHLWPEFFRLIGECRPGFVMGEQVASRDGLAWLDLVHADLEGAGYTVRAVDLCAAGVGAPHIRQRLWWVGVADTDAVQRSRRDGEPGTTRDEQGPGAAAQRRGPAIALADGLGQGLSVRQRQALLGEGRGSQGGATEQRGGSPALGLGDAARVGGADQRGGDGSTGQHVRVVDRAAGRGGDGFCAEGDREVTPGDGREAGLWSDLEWLPCRDGKARPTRPGLFPLAHGVSARVGKLRAAGNAIVPEVGAAFARAVMAEFAPAQPRAVETGE